VIGKSFPQAGSGEDSDEEEEDKVADDEDEAVDELCCSVSGTVAVVVAGRESELVLLEFVLDIVSWVEVPRVTRRAAGDDARSVPSESFRFRDFCDSAGGVAGAAEGPGTCTAATGGAAAGGAIVGAIGAGRKGAARSGAVGILKPPSSVLG